MNKFVREQLIKKSSSMLENKKKMEHLNKTIELNDRSIDYMENELLRSKDLYNLTENDIDKEKVELNEYILFSLKYLKEMYTKSLVEFRKVIK